MRFLLTLISVIFFYSGLASGKEDSFIKIGTSLPLSGHASYLGEEVLSGMKAYLKAINEKGGVCGHKIILKAYDDKYSPPLMIGNVKTLVEKDKVLALISLVGTPTTLTVVKYCENKGIPLLFPITGAIELRKPVRKNIFNLRPSYWDECKLAVDFFIKKGFRRFAIVYQNDAYGLNGLEATRRRLFCYDMEPVISISYLRGQANINQIVTRLIEAKPDIVFFIGTANIGELLIKEYRKRTSSIPTFYAVSFAGVKDMAERLENLPVKMYITTVLPYYVHKNTPAIKEYRKLMQHYFPKKELSALSFEGFLNAKLLVKVLEKIEGEISSKKLIETLENLQNFDLGIKEKINLSPESHQGLNKVFLLKIEHGKIFQVNTTN
ncbi:ABC transporter substrate-binding protein [Thermodesulfatator autotrophicus]|uniref:Leucine-binding protein domain-containing protein n=1 Tax=Thermodesulfatator autotrophicus TaxID=1795632 RepID=A0A177E6M7_9BACT|nr:ABC transporter substrate-binding protein [Thermodesulfatator autotrophicus]OAG27438.1 hypothetical protein TH606_06760 [Thermodesulfatator autotrophicus]